MTAWATSFRAADSRIREAQRALQVALDTRCPHVDSGGAQCTADASPAHEHRYLDDDLPGYDPTEF